jgi:cellulose synthase operon protein C
MPRHLERTLLREENLKRRLQWLSLCERLNETDKVVGWLSNVGPDQQGTPRDLMFLALAMDRYLGDARSLPIAYRALRGGYDDPQIHLNYTVGLFLTGRVGRSQIETPEQVGPDTAVILVEKEGGRRLTRVIETEPNPRIDRDEIALKDSLTSRLMGLRVGDEVELKTLATENAQYIVSSIQNKYVHAHFRSLERFETMFPESRAFGSLSIDPSKGDQQFKPIFDVVKSKGEFAKQIKSLYRSGRLPLVMAARFGGSSGFEFWEAILGDPDLQFNVVLGRPEDYAEVQNLLSDGKRRAVVDPITLYGLVRLNVAEIVRDSFDDLGVVQTTLDLLRREVHDGEESRGREQRVLGWDGEHYQMLQLGPEAIEDRISQAQAVLTFAETLTLVPAEAVGGIKDEAKQLFDELDFAYLDTVLAAKGDDRILLSDDLAFRLLAAEAAQIRTVWTQVSVGFAAGVHEILPEDYFQMGNTLAQARYFFTSINSGNFFHALKQSRWSLSPTLRTLIDLLARAPNVPRGVLNVLGDLAKIGWAQKTDVEAYETLFAAIFAAFNKAQPDRDLETLANAAFFQVQKFLRGGFLVQFRDRLLQSTYLKPAGTIADEGRRIQDVLAARIGHSLGQALHKARMGVREG